MSNKKKWWPHRLPPHFFYDFFLYNMVLWAVAVLVVVARNWADDGLVVSKWFDGEVSAEHTVISEKELVVVCVFFVYFVLDVHIVVVVVDCVWEHRVLDVHQGLLSKFRALDVEDLLKNSALVSVVQVDDWIDRNGVVERVGPIGDVKSAEHIVAQRIVEVNLAPRFGSCINNAHALPLVVNENRVDVLNPFLEIYTVHREELGAGCGQVNCHLKMNLLKVIV